MGGAQTRAAFRVGPVGQTTPKESLKPSRQKLVTRSGCGKADNEPHGAYRLHDTHEFWKVTSCQLQEVQQKSLGAYLNFTSMEDVCG